MKNSWILNVKEAENGEPYIELPDELISSLGWKEGDTVIWTDNHDGSWSLTKAVYVHGD